MNKCVYMIQLVEEKTDHMFTEIKVHKCSGNGGHTMFFGGDAMWQWGLEHCGNLNPPDGTTDHIRNHGQNICWAEWLHNGLTGMHTTILHAGFDEFCVHENHEDYAFVERLFELAQMPEAEVLGLTDGIVKETCK